jgi:hypothetical protein
MASMPDRVDEGGEAPCWAHLVDDGAPPSEAVEQLRDRRERTESVDVPERGDPDDGVSVARRPD